LIEYMLLLLVRKYFQDQKSSMDLNYSVSTPSHPISFLKVARQRTIEITRWLQ
jgi:hypothetical protein